VVREGACLSVPPPALPVLEVPPCREVDGGPVVCDPLPLEVEAAIEGYMRRINAWAADAWAACSASTPPVPPIAPSEPSR